MEKTIEIHADHLRVVVKGPYESRAARHGLSDAIRQGAERGLTRIVVDARGLTSRVSIADRYHLAMHLAAHASVRFRMVIVVSEKNAFTKMLEDTATERRIDLRTTTAMRDAWDYLDLDGEPPGD